MLLLLVIILKMLASQAFTKILSQEATIWGILGLKSIISDKNHHFGLELVDKTLKIAQNGAR